MSKVTTVTNERKNELLLEARKARVSWIQCSKIPYQHFEEDPAPLPQQPQEQHDRSTNSNNPIHDLSPSNIIQSIPSSLKVLDLLLEGKSQEEKLTLTNEWKSELRLDLEAKRQEELVGSIDDHAFLFYYSEIVERLCLPECKDIVQGMRHFVKSLEELTIRIQKEDPTSKEEGHMTQIKDAMCTYLENLYDTLASHPLWRENSGLSHDTKMMVDTFVYSKCYTHIMKVMVSEELQVEESYMQDRLQFLNEFVEPVHLELNLWNDINSNLHYVEEETEYATPCKPWEQDLVNPIALLHGLGKLYSPAQMLRCILDVYRGINDTLKNLFLHHKGGKAPSADDILPTLILTVICARPKKIMSILTFVEWFATDEQKRGENGYAFATLYSAMQFIKELDLEQRNDDEKDTSKPTLHMSQAEMKELLRNYLERKRDIFSEQQMNVTDASSQIEGVTQDMDISSRSLDAYQPISISLHEVTAARLRGENLNEWAQRYIDSNEESWKQPAQIQDDEEKKQFESLHQQETLSLPDGFTRSYKYLSADPNNVRLVEIPGILEEYSMLVRTVETLISERNSYLRHHRKDETKLKKERLEASLAEIEKGTDSLS